MYHTYYVLRCQMNAVHKIKLTIAVMMMMMMTAHITTFYLLDTISAFRWYHVSVSSTHIKYPSFHSSFSHFFLHSMDERAIKWVFQSNEAKWWQPYACEINVNIIWVGQLWFNDVWHIDINWDLKCRKGLYPLIININIIIIIVVIVTIKDVREKWIRLENAADCASGESN